MQQKHIYPAVIVILVIIIGFLIWHKPAEAPQREVLPGEGTATTTNGVYVYFHNSRLDHHTTDCHAVYPVERKIDKDPKAALLELLQGPTDDERREEYSSVFSDKTADALISFRVNNKTAYIDLKDIRNVIPNANTSCGSAAFFAEVEKTVKEFGGVNRVLFAFNASPKDFYEWMQIGCSLEEVLCDEKPFADDKPKAVPFSQTGTLSDWDAANENHTGNFKLIYDMPGAPGLSADLSVSTTTTCTQLAVDVPCIGILQSGKRARITGEILGNIINASHIEVTF